jgi:hypothetical protein
MIYYRPQRQKILRNSKRAHQIRSDAHSRGRYLPLFHFLTSASSSGTVREAIACREISTVSAIAGRDVEDRSIAIR